LAHLVNTLARIQKRQQAIHYQKLLPNQHIENATQIFLKLSMVNIARQAIGG